MSLKIRRIAATAVIGLGMSTVVVAAPAANATSATAADVIEAQNSVLQEPERLTAAKATNRAARDHAAARAESIEAAAEQNAQEPVTVSTAGTPRKDLHPAPVEDRPVAHPDVAPVTVKSPKAGGRIDPVSVTAKPGSAQIVSTGN